MKQTKLKLQWVEESVEGKPFSETLRLLLNHTKRNNDEGFTFKSIRELLGPHYHPDMRLKDVLIVINNAFQEMLQIKEFEIGNRNLAQFEILLSPFNSIFPLGESVLFGPKLEDKFTIEQFYDKVISEYMHKFMFTNIGWCRDYVFPEEKEQ